MSLASKQCLSCGASLRSGELECDYCGTAHIMEGSTFGVRCNQCGGSNRPDSSNCVHCNTTLLSRCVECFERNPLGSRFCGECKIEFASYRQAKVRGAPDKIGEKGIEKAVLNWLDSGWFKARDIRDKVVIMDAELNWFPVWRFSSQVCGKVQGKQSQTHYRTTTRREYDEAEGIWKTIPSSEPYKVWQEVSKEFNRRVNYHDPAVSDAKLEQVIESKYRSLRLTEIEGDAPACSQGQVLKIPHSDSERVFREYRARARQFLKSELLEQVEMMEVRFLGPSLELIYYPVWAVIYRYKRKRKKMWINGATKESRGQSLSILSQWFG